MQDIRVTSTNFKSLICKVNRIFTTYASLLCVNEAKELPKLDGAPTT